MSERVIERERERERERKQTRKKERKKERKEKKKRRKKRLLDNLKSIAVLRAERGGKSTNITHRVLSLDL